MGASRKRSLMNNSIITLTTDFGTDSPYVAQMKGVILSINPAVSLVDITHAVPPQDVAQGALALMDATPRFPLGSIHVCVVDPGVGTERKIVCAEIGGRLYVAPDNGLLGHLIRGAPPTRVVLITNTLYQLPTPSMTFHGRDIMAPAAAHLSLGTDIEALGPPAGGLVQLDWPTVVVENGRIAASVITRDSFGNLITNIERGDFAAMDSRESAIVHCGGRAITGIVSTYSQQPPGTVVALFGSSGRLEIAVVNGNAAEELNVWVGDPVTVALDTPA
jgi:S-adenosyl-L-methionine hydrolase (adenosine-forming)